MITIPVSSLIFDSVMLVVLTIIGVMWRMEYVAERRAKEKLEYEYLLKEKKASDIRLAQLAKEIGIRR